MLRVKALKRFSREKGILPYGQNDNGKATARYSIKNVDGKDIVSIDTDQNVFEGVERKDYGKVAREYIKAHFRGNSVNDVAFTKYSEKEYTKSKETQRLYSADSSVYDTKMKASTELDNFVRTGEFIRHEKANHPHSYNEGGYDRYAVEFELGGESFSGEMLVAKNSANKAMFYDIVKIKEKNNLRYPDALTVGSEGGKNVLSNNSIRENGVNVNSFSRKNAKTNSQTVGNFSGITYSSSLKGRENTLKYQPVAAEQATEYAKAALRNIELVSGGRVDVVLTDGANLTTADGRQANGEYADGVVYVNANADSYERAMFIASHELTHTLEGTGEYQRLGEFIKERVAADPALAKKYDLEKYRAAYANAQAGDFSAETLEYQAATEMYADFVAKEILGNEDVVRHLAAKQRNIAVRFLEWVRSAVRRMGGGRETQAEYKALKKAEKLLSAALENAKGGVTLEEVEEDVQTAKAVKTFFEGEETEDVKKDVDNTSSSRYNISKRATKYISYSSIGEDNIKYIRAELVRLYDGLESGIADGIAIERDSTVYIVDSGKDRGDISFGIRKKISISNDELRVEFIRRTNNESISKGFISDGLSSRIRGKHDNDRGSDRRYQTGEKLSADTGKSENQQKRISDENAVGGGSVRHSLDVEEHAKKKKKKDTLRKYLGRMEITEDTKERLRSTYGETVAQRIIDTWDNTFDEKGKKSYYNQYTTLAMQWAYSNATKEGDTRVLYNAQDQTWNKLVADDSNEGYSVLLSVKDTEENIQKINELLNEEQYDNNGKEQRVNESIYTDIERYEHIARGSRNVVFYAEEQGADGQSSDLDKSESNSDRRRVDDKSSRNKQSVRHSLDVESAEKSKRFDGYATALRNYLHRLNISEETKAEKLGQKYVKTNQTLEKILCL